MKTYISPKFLLLLVFGLLLVVHAVKADEKTPPSTLQIGIKHHVPEEECTRKTKNGDKLKMHYHGTLFSNGEVFDSSYNRGTPFEFKLGAGQVIKGWDQGLLDMCVGEKRKLVIPPQLAYGDRAMGSIKKGSTLVFDVELIEIVGVPLLQKQEL